MQSCFHWRIFFWDPYIIQQHAWNSWFETKHVIAIDLHFIKLACIDFVCIFSSLSDAYNHKNKSLWKQNISIKKHLKIWKVGQIDRYLMFYAQSTAKTRIRAKHNEFLPQVQILIHFWSHILPLRIGEICGKWSWMSWEGRVCRSPVSRHSIHHYNYIFYYRLSKREPLIPLGSHQGGPLNFRIRGRWTPPGGRCAK